MDELLLGKYLRVSTSASSASPTPSLESSSQALHSPSGQEANTARMADALPPVKKSRWRSTSTGRTLLSREGAGEGEELVRGY